MSEYYSYVWLSPDGEPYYVGKGSGDRAFENHPRSTWCSVMRPTDRARILVFPQDSEDDALESEREIIALFGRETLLNRNCGGSRGFGMRHSDESKAKISKSLFGTKRHLGHKHSPEVRAKLSAHAKADIQNSGRFQKGHIVPAEWAEKSRIAAMGNTRGHALKGKPWTQARRDAI